MKNFRSAIVGCGGIAQVHARALSEMENVRLAAYADTKPERAQALASQYGGQAYASLEALLDQESIDVLHICTPHFLHLPMAQAAASRGIAVFTEKPPVISRTQWQDFQALPGPVGVCFQNRFNSSVAYAQKRLEEGALGPVLGARAFVTWRREAPYYTESGWRGALDTEGGGALINQAIHTLDLMVRFLGPARSAQAVQANFHLPGVIQVEDTLAAYIRFAEATGVFYATTAHAVDAPILLELACQQLGVPCAQSVYVGDHPFDVLCAHSAHMPAIWMPVNRFMTLPAGVGAPEHTIHSLLELPAALKEIETPRVN